jgi:hypothetical protein
MMLMPRYARTITNGCVEAFFARRRKKNESKLKMRVD